MSKLSQELVRRARELAAKSPDAELAHVTLDLAQIHEMQDASMERLFARLDEVERIKEGVGCGTRLSR